MVNEAAKLEKCEGLPTPCMRAWLHGMTLAMGCTPQIDPPNQVQQAVVDRDLGRKLMNRTARGDLVVEIDQDITAHTGHTTTKTLESLEVTFLWGR